MTLDPGRGRRHIVLVGMMGAGKSTVGRRLAALLGRNFVDTDDDISALTGKSVAELFSSEGEARFRAVESQVLREALESHTPSVIAVGGGAVLDSSNRELIARTCEVVWLRAETATLAERVEGVPERPLLGDDAAGALAKLEPERRPLYEEVARSTIDVDALGADATVRAVIDAIQRRVEVALGERSYEVVIGPGARHLLSSVIPGTARRAAIVSQAGVNISIDPGIESDEFVIGIGEQAKSLHTVEELCRGFARAGLHRNDVVVAVGGGVVTDVAGFAASSFHRGLPVIHVATTLLAQIDAAIGGKTGVNLPEGKNLVGSFWQPHAVLCDTDTLATLPERDWRSGLGEMAKYAFLGVDNLDEMPLVDRVATCVRLKAQVVSVDERESERRMVLNYGHTLAHALEAAQFSTGGADVLRHGEAVAIGLVFSARLARVLGRIDDARVKRHLAVVEEYGLPTTIPEGIDLELLVGLMQRDKKSDGEMTFALDGPSGVEVVRNVPIETVRAALSEMSGPATADGVEPQ